ncbi:MAG TPA: ATP-binding protein [Woeseiaceae bacterium]|nr:ATP-binding protein [Woeseiaceae bacterium]
MYADIALVQRVLENLMRNALKFTPAGGQVVISLDCHPDRVAVAIADTGCGIARQDLDRVFERGYGTGQESASTGLGLAIVRRILDLHGCRIAVSSEVGKGTRFEFALPTGRAA